MKSKTYLITGATSGIGQAVYAALAAQGHTLIPVVRNQDRLTHLPGKPANYIVTDMADPVVVEAAFKSFDTKLDGVINAAGLLVGHSMQQTTLQELNNTFAVNVLSPFVVLKAVESYLNTNACIVLFGSISGHKGSFDDAYAASKGAVHALVRSLSLKLAPRARVVGIAPGMTEHTRMTDNLLPGRFEETREARIPLKQAAQPEDLAVLVSFVLSDAARFMTGSIIDINGGQYLRT
ncbi:MAG TPA: SDR family oxidoreductase [Alphaproteobacteria bacterium]|nr:SDR family oxidoreductase [Alphaproteobacteria bacterium]